MAGSAADFARNCPAISTATAVTTNRLIHYYHAELTAGSETVRIFTLAPQISDSAVHSAFEETTGKWLNPSTHPNIVTVHETGTDPRPWIAVDLVDGRRLDSIQGDLSVAQIRTVLIGTAEALRNAALYNTTHGSLAPDTIWVTESDDGIQPVVDKWGLERACRMAIDAIPTGPYVAPEFQNTSTPNMEQADVYRLGGVAYYLLTGQEPTLPSSESDSLVPPSELSSHSAVTEEVDRVVLTALAPTPDKRYESVYAFQTAIANALPDTTDELSAVQSDGQSAEGISQTEKTSRSGEDSDDEPSNTDEPEDPDESDDGGYVTRRAALGMLGLGTVGAAGTASWYFSSMGQDSQTSQPTSDRIVWTHETPANLLSSPAVIDETVVIGGSNSINALYTRDGSARWIHEVGSYKTSSPTVVEDAVYIGNHDYSVYALDIQGGSEKWTYETDWGVESSPAVVEGTVYVGSGDGSVYALNANTGSEQWTYETDREVYSSPAVMHGTVYIGSSDNSVYALDATDGAEQWSFGTNDGITSSPSVVDDTVYVGSRDGRVYALETDTGSEQWNYQTWGEVRSSPAVVDGIVYVGSESGNVYALNTRDGSERWRYETGGVIDASPAVVNETVYIGSRDGYVYALDTTDGTERWSYETEVPVASSPAVVDDTVYIGDEGGTVHALETEEPTDNTWPMYSYNNRNTSYHGSAENNSIYGGYLDHAINFDGTTADMRGDTEVTVLVGNSDDNSGVGFSPPAVRIDPGATVTFEWRNGIHNVVQRNQVFVSGAPTEKPDEDFSVTFEQEGVYKYYCSHHQGLGMKGVVAVGTSDRVVTDPKSVTISRSTNGS